MSYWMGMVSVLLIGYALIKWNGRANDQDEGRYSLNSDCATSVVGLRAVATANTKSQASNNGKDTSHNGGKA